VRVLVSVDVEDIAGVVDVDDIRPGHPEYSEASDQAGRG
jgi:D-aminopeptidase